jgi:isocitrate/isopropylmalate dehydrogenase
LTIVHKANVLKATCGLFREVAFDVVKDYPELTVNEMLVDACAMVMVMDTSRFDVIVTSNLFGDILSDLAAGLTGGPGLAPSANVGEGVPLFEPVHGSAPDIAGQGIADPRAAILSTALMLNELGYSEVSQYIASLTRETSHTGNTNSTVKAVLAKL